MLKLNKPKFWQYNSILSILLTPLSLIYYTIVISRKVVTKSYKSPIPIICIGNVTIGGAGKTPTAIAIAKILKKKGKNIAFLSRGYKGSISEATIVDDKKHSAREVGDEPLLLSKEAMTIVAKNRKEGIKLAQENNIDLIIMDDGMQNPSIEKDMCFLVIDGNYGLGNNKLLPAGPLRETLDSALEKATAIIFIGKDRNNILGDNKVSAKIKSNKIIKAEIEAKKNAAFDDKKLIAFSAIANNDKFFNSLEELNYNVVETISFPDHYYYTEGDFKKLQKIASDKSAKLITTEKDFVKLTKTQQQNVFTLPIQIKWKKKHDITKFL